MTTSQKMAELLFREARLLDRLEYEAWLDMLSDRLRYHAPVRGNESDEQLESPRRLALFDDRKADLVTRIKRLRTGHAHAEQPPSRVRRLITNVLVLEASERVVDVASSFLVTVSRWDRPAQLFSGSREDRWADEGGPELRLLERRILFDASTVTNMSFLL